MTVDLSQEKNQQSSTPCMNLVQNGQAVIKRLFDESPPITNTRLVHFVADFCSPAHITIAHFERVIGSGVRKRQGSRGQGAGGRTPYLYVGASNNDVLCLALAASLQLFLSSPCLKAGASNRMVCILLSPLPPAPLPPASSVSAATERLYLKSLDDTRVITRRATQSTSAIREVL